MSTISQILSEKFPGKSWRIDADDYATLVFLDNDSKFTVSEEDIRQYSNEVDGLLADRRAKEERQSYLLADSGSLFGVVEALAASVKELQVAVLALNPDAAFSKTAEVAALVAKVDATKIDVPVAAESTGLKP